MSAPTETVYDLQPYGGFSQLFPDNGIITTNVDKRVTQNERLEVASKLFHKGTPYETKKKIDGTVDYIWNETFLELVEESLASGYVQNFSKAQKALFDDYLACAMSGDFSTASEEVKALNKYLALEKK